MPLCVLSKGAKAYIAISFPIKIRLRTAPSSSSSSYSTVPVKSVSITCPTLERLTFHNSQMPFQSHNSAANMPPSKQLSYQVQYWKKPMGINDHHNFPISDTAAAEIRQNATQNLSRLPGQLHQLAVGSTWERSSEQSMREYQLLDYAAQNIDILKAMNIRDRDRNQEEASRKKKEEAPGVLNAIKYWVCPQEMKKTRNEMRELRERGRYARCVKDCMPEILDGTDMRWSGTPDFVYVMKNVEWIMEKARATATKVQTDNPDGHWAIELLNFYSDSWIVWLDDFNENFQPNSYDLDKKIEGAKQRAEVAEEIVEEIEKERRKRMPVGLAWGLASENFKERDP